MDLAGRQAAAQALVESHLDLVDLIAVISWKKVRRYIELEELKSAGYVGLMEASQRFSTDRGVLFRTFAQRRIRGAMLDYIRRESPAKKFHLRHIKAGLLPPVQRVPLQRIQPNPDLDREVSEHSAVDSDVDHLTNKRLEQAIADLPDRQRRVIRRRYFEGGTQASLCPEFGVKYSQVSVLHAQALATLRRVMDASAPS